MTDQSDMRDPFPNDAEYQAVCAHLKSLKWRSMPTKAEVRAMRDAITSKPSAPAVVPAAGDAGRTVLLARAKICADTSHDPLAANLISDLANYIRSHK